MKNSKLKKIVAGGIAALTLAMGIGMSSASAASITMNGISANPTNNVLGYWGVQPDCAVKNNDGWPVTVTVYPTDFYDITLTPVAKSITMTLQAGEKKYFLFTEGVLQGVLTYHVSVVKFDGKNLGSFNTTNVYMPF